MPDTRFCPVRHGLPFGNCWPTGQPLWELPTPFGVVPVGRAAAGVCGGMVFAALDAFHRGEPPPPEATPAVFRALSLRLLESWDLFGGGLRYVAWQMRWDAFTPTVRFEWPRVRRRLDRGEPTPLGLVTVRSWDVRSVGRNHQVLAVGYREDGDATAIRIYDPNWPGDGDVALTWRAGDGVIRHSLEGATVRGFFGTRYRRK